MLLFVGQICPQCRILPGKSAARKEGLFGNYSFSHHSNALAGAAFIDMEIGSFKDPFTGFRLKMSKMRWL